MSGQNISRSGLKTIQNEVMNMKNESVFDWEILNGKLLKIHVTSPDGSVIGVDEETGKSYMLRQKQHMVLNFPRMEEPIKKRGWF